MGRAVSAAAGAELATTSSFITTAWLRSAMAEVSAAGGNMAILDDGFMTLRRPGQWTVKLSSRSNSGCPAG
jgi:hypothetical protein